MTPTSRLYDALNDFLSQSEYQWHDLRHLKTLLWMIVGILESQSIHLNGFGVYVKSRAKYAQSHQRRFRRWSSHRRIDIQAVHQALMTDALANWGKHRLYLSLDTTVVWNCFCIVWVGVVFRGRTLPVAWTIVAQASSTVRLWTIQRVLRQVARVTPTGVEVVLLADRGFADGKLMKHLKETLHWHFRIRIKRSFHFQLQGHWHKVSEVILKAGDAYCTGAGAIGKTRPYSRVYLAFAHDKLSGEYWVIVSDEPTNLQTFCEYRLRFQVKESFLDLKSNGFQLEASRLRDKFSLCQLCGLIALTTLFLVWQGVQVVATQQRRRVDLHWYRGMSYLKLGWNWILSLSYTRTGNWHGMSYLKLGWSWIRLALTEQRQIHLYWTLSGAPDPEPALASKRQLEHSLSREFIVLSRFPAS